MTESIEKIKEAFSTIRGYPEINVKGYQLFTSEEVFEMKLIIKNLMT